MPETARLMLREYTMEDVPLLHAIVSDPVTMSFYPVPFTLEKTTAWIERSIQNFGEFGLGRFAVILKETGDLIGCAGFFRTEVNGKLETDLGYIFDKLHWGKGYATEAALSCIEVARATNWTHRIVIQMAADHLRSAHVAERLGAKLETRFVNQRNRMKLTKLFVVEV